MGRINVELEVTEIYLGYGNKDVKLKTPIKLGISAYRAWNCVTNRDMMKGHLFINDIAVADLYDDQYQNGFYIEEGDLYPYEKMKELNETYDIIYLIQSLFHQIYFSKEILEEISEKDLEKFLRKNLED